jgi:CubicO group peptidase (beta-lactamase class C family)
MERTSIKRRLSFLLFLILLSPSFVHGDDVDEYIKLRMAKEHLPGLSLAVLKNGRVVKLKGYGYADLELRVAASPETVYGIGSITKQFTAAAVLLLVQEGRINLDDAISKYISSAPEAWKDITIRNLLTHTSGLPREGIPTSDKTMFADYTEEELLKSAIEQHLLSVPGAKYSYGNLEYDLLAIIVERVSGKSYPDFLQERIFRPLGMTSTRVDDRRAIVPNRARAYLWTSGSLQRCEPQVSPTMFIGSGSMISTAADLARWDTALNSDAVLSATSRKAMWTPAKLADGTNTDYGFGWVISSVKGHADIHHNGAMNGFVGNISRFLDDRLTVIVLVNQSGLSNTERIATGVARIYVPAIRPAIQGRQPRPVKVDPTVYASVAGRYEYWGNFMLTLTPGTGVLLGQLPVGEADDYVPISATSFWQPEEGVQLTVITNEAGDITGLRVREDDGNERTIPRIGPLFSMLHEQPDPDPKRTQQVGITLQAFEHGGKEVEESTMIAPAAKKDFQSGTTDFLGLRSLSYVATQELAGSGLERHGAKVDRIIYYHLISDRPPANLVLYLTAYGLLADYDIVDN